MEIRLAGIVPESVVDGPGIRFVIFTQGCPHQCLDCQNPDTHDFLGGQIQQAEQVFARYRNHSYVKGITISGGEPFCQAQACAYLAKLVKEAGGDVVVYTGYTFEQLKKMGESQPAVTEFLDSIDLLIDGPYDREKRDLGLAFRGSSNQRIINVPLTKEYHSIVEVAFD